MDIQSERRRLLDAEGDGDPTGLLSEQEAYLRYRTRRGLLETTGSNSFPNHTNAIKESRGRLELITQQSLTCKHVSVQLVNLNT